jgi:hypothetical protein
MRILAEEWIPDPVVVTRAAGVTGEHAHPFETNGLIVD